MTTHEMEKRFTAQEACAFAEKHLIQGLSEKHLHQKLAPSSSRSSPVVKISEHMSHTSPWSSYDRWADLPVSFFKDFPQWGDYVTPPLPKWKMYLRKVCETDKGRRRVGRIRKVLSVVGIGDGLRY